MKMHRTPDTPGVRAVLIAGFCILVCWCVRADYVRIDVDGRSDATASGFLTWVLGSDLSAATSNRVATHVFTNIPSGNLTCVVAQTMPTIVDSTIYLKALWLNKNGLGHYNLAFDGVWIVEKNDALGIDRPYLNGGAISLSISGLAPGPHTITTYHNDIWGTNKTWVTNGDYSMSKCVVSVGSNAMATVTPSLQVTNDNDIAFSFFTVNAQAGQPVVISFDPDHTGALDNVILNGFEIDRAAPPGKAAVVPLPADGDEHAFANNDAPLPGTASSGYLTLRWLPGLGAVSHDVYFGTNSNAVATATHASPQFKGNQAATNYFVTNLTSAATYFWRIDEVNATNGVTAGFVWRFRTRHLAFPGAEGYGRFARGGRGGIVIEVTNLLDYDTTLGEAIIPGSYRAAIEASGPRTIVFRVSGFIPLKRPCTINANGSVTIAGQTAPGDGICIGNYRAGAGSSSDVIMRFVRNRVGDFCRQAMDGIGLSGCDHSIVDHCSISWTIDEGTSSRSAKNITFQRNLISEALNNSYHYASGNTNLTERHSFAGSISGGISSYHHNLLAHNTGRNWSLAGGLTQGGQYDGYLDIRNNVIYNWKDRTTDGGAKQVNFVANFYKPGPVTTLFKLMRPDSGSPTDRQQYFVTNNILLGYYAESNNWSGIQVQGGATEADVRVDAPFFPDYVTTHTASNAYQLVLSDVGANFPRQDAIDSRVISETRNGTYTYTGSKDGLPGIIDSQDDVGGYPTNAYNTSNLTTDTDHDGLPDWWEIMHGLNPNSLPGDFSDSNGDLDADGYTNLEDYLNWLAAPHVVARQSGSVDVDLRAFAAGLTDPVFAVFGPTNGSVLLLPDGFTGRFSPTLNFSGAASFRFTASDGATLSNSVEIMVAPSLRLGAGARIADDTFSLPGGGALNAVCVLQIASNLSAPILWQDAATNLTTNGAFNFVTPISTNEPQRFFRVFANP
ncbi:MAG TPA: T9SS C-terminal target domain-containing protein [Verrucomicrobiae bacterium]